MFYILRKGTFVNITCTHTDVCTPLSTEPSSGDIGLERKPLNYMWSRGCLESFLTFERTLHLSLAVGPMLRHPTCVGDVRVSAHKILPTPFEHKEKPLAHTSHNILVSEGMDERPEVWVRSRSG